MKKILKNTLLVILIISSIGILYFISKWNRINIDENIGKSQEIKNLDSKVFDHTFLIFDSTKVQTDFKIFANKNDTVTFNFNASKSPKLENIETLIFNSGDGFAGVNINILKYKNFFYTSAENYTDAKRTFDFLESGRYQVKKQKLTLNKSEYNKGDSIFGKIELQIKFTPTNEIINSNGYFRGIIE